MLYILNIAISSLYTLSFSLYMFDSIFITIHSQYPFLSHFTSSLAIHSQLILSSLFCAKGVVAQWPFFSSFYFTHSSFTFISLCQRGRGPVVFHITLPKGRSPVVFHFTLPKGMRPSDLSVCFAKGDATQWSFFPFTLPKGMRPSGLPILLFLIHFTISFQYTLFSQLDYYLIIISQSSYQVYITNIILFSQLNY